MTTMWSSSYRHRLNVSLAGAMAAVLLLAAPAFAYIAQTYQSSLNLAVGTVVSLDSQTTQNVVPADLDHLGTLLGVVADKSTATASSVLVASNGIAVTEVSTLGGDIHTGDPITVSSIQGVGMKATTVTKLLGIAQADFSASSSNAVHQLVRDINGTTHDFAFGVIPVQLGVADFRAAVSADSKSALPSSIRHFFDAVGGHRVSTPRELISLMLLALVLIVITLVIETSVRGSIISLGRNPLIKNSLLLAMAEILGVCLALLLVTLSVIYLIIR